MRKPKLVRNIQFGVNLTEDLLMDLKKLAFMEGVTASYKSYQILKQHVDENRNKINAYDEFIREINNKEV